MLRYGAAAGVTALAFAARSLWPGIYEGQFVLFLAAVLVSARFFGFGPALACTGLSALALGRFVLVAAPGIHASRLATERLVVFVGVSVLAAGLARQRSRAETRASEMRQRMAAIVESSRDAILSANLEGIITSWNRGAEALYGYTAEEAIGRHVSLMALPERKWECGGNVVRIRKGEPVEGHQTEHRHRDGTRIRVLLSISPLRDFRGQVIGSSAIVRDITEQKRAEELLRRNERLATAGRLAATIAHEINNPLEALTNLLYLARRSSGERDKYLRMAENEVSRVATIAQQTLGFVREGPARELNICETIEQVLHLYAANFAPKRIRVETRLDRGAEIQGFGGELQQLFANLVLNATDAMRDGGCLRVHVSCSHEWSSQRSGVRITIADTGTGIADADKSRLFEPFFTTKEELGTGLGLWISQGIVQKHGGRIRLRSRTCPGRSGTVVSVFLPMAAASVKVA